MKVVGMKVENLCNLHLLDAQLDGRNLVIGGKNGHGKTTALRAIEAALRGARQCKILDPIREGEDKATVLLDLGDYLVEKRFNKSGETLVVKTKDGAEYGQGQGLLNKLMGSISINPAAFLEMSDKQQLETLLKICPIDLDIQEHDEKYKAIFEKRSDVNRDLKNISGEIAGFGTPPEGLPEKEISVMDLVNRRREAEQKIQDVERYKQSHQEAIDGIATLEEQVAIEKEKLADMPEQTKQALEEARIEYERICKEIRDGHAEAEKVIDAGIKQLCQDIEKTREVKGRLEVEIENTELPDLEALDKDIENVEETNRKIRKKLELDDRIAKKETIKAESDKLTKVLKGMDAKKSMALSEANIPVPEISVGSGQILYNGHPFKEASHAQQVSAALRLLIAQDPELKIITLQDASLMDEDTTELIRTVAEEKGYQVFFEVVANSDDQMAIHITEGDAGIFLTNGEVTSKTSVEDTPKPEKKPSKKKKTDVSDKDLEEYASMADDMISDQGNKKDNITRDDNGDPIGKDAGSQAYEAPEEKIYDGKPVDI